MNDERDDSEFRKELENLINKYSMENGSDTPDFILADYLKGTLDIFDRAVGAREGWYGRKNPTFHHTAPSPCCGGECECEKEMD